MMIGSVTVPSVPLISLEQLRYHPATVSRPLLENVSMAANVGDIALIAGPSGSGKSTLLDLVAGLARPDAGRIRWCGKPLGQGSRRKLCGLMFQFPERHFLGLTLQQELRLGHRRLSDDRIGEVLQQVGLRHLSPGQSPERLSGGQQRRLALAVQLLRNPSVLLLDEPTAGLDWSVRHQLIQVLNDLRQGRVLVVVTHEPELFASLQPRCWQLRDGELLAAAAGDR